MKVKKLVLRNFRNIAECTLVPDENVNFLIGNNGQGKTSFLEALSYLAVLRSFRGSKSSEVIRWGEESAEISCAIGSEDFETELRVVLRPHEKAAFINGKAYKSSTQYLSQRFGHFELGFHAIVFNPSDHDLVRGEPACRRAYLDRVICAEDVEYLKVLQKYKKVLEQRNALLKTKPPSPSLRDQLLGFTEPLARYAAELTLKRLKWIERVAGCLNAAMQQITSKEIILKLLYLSNWAPNIQNLSFDNDKLSSLHFSGQEHLPSLELLEQAFWNKASLLEAAELKSGHTLVGPHRDDWTFFLGGHVLKGHGSQGEVRSALLALKLAEIELFRSATGHRPLFLLDDFSSELDQEKRSFLLRFLAETDLQSFVTTTEEISTLASGKRFRVERGKLNDHRTETNQLERRE